MWRGLVWLNCCSTPSRLLTLIPGKRTLIPVLWQWILTQGLLSKKITSSCFSHHCVHSCVKMHTGTGGQSQVTFWSLMRYLKTLPFCMSKQGLNLGTVGFLFCFFLFNCCFLGHLERREQVCQTRAKVVFVFVWWQLCRSVFTSLYVQVPSCPVRNSAAH